ncbi:hypothetical protein ACFWW5_10955 [Streptomyces albidoflavus]
MTTALVRYTADSITDDALDDLYARIAALETQAQLDRNAAYDATWARIRDLGTHMPADTLHRNAMIWRAVNGALDAAGTPTLDRLETP